MAFPRKEAQNPFFRTLLLNLIVWEQIKKYFSVLCELGTLCVQIEGTFVFTGEGGGRNGLRRLFRAKGRDGAAA